MLEKSKKFKPKETGLTLASLFDGSGGFPLARIAFANEGYDENKG